jgi:hypothetical protein
MAIGPPPEGPPTIGGSQELRDPAALRAVSSSSRDIAGPLPETSGASVAVLTTDVLIEGARRDDVFAYLARPENHRQLVEGAFDGLQERSPGVFELAIKAPPRPRSLNYQFEGPDDSHGGRRVYIKTSGRRLEGKLSYSLRTMKPSTNTLVTLHLDFDPGVAGLLVLRMGLQARLERGMGRILENLSRSLVRSA